MWEMSVMSDDHSIDHIPFTVMCQIYVIFSLFGYFFQQIQESLTQRYQYLNKIPPKNQDELLKTKMTKMYWVQKGEEIN